MLKMIQWNYQLTKQNWPACELGILQPFNRFSFAFGSKKLPGLSRNGPLETSLTRSFTGYHEAAQKRLGQNSIPKQSHRKIRHHRPSLSGNHERLINSKSEKNTHSFLFGGRPNRFFEIACFDSKLQ